MTSRTLPVLLALAIGAAFFCALGAHPYITPSEARYIEIPRQMIITGDWIVPRLNGVPYFEKPPLFDWMQAALFSVFGWGEFAGRALTALFSVGICLLAYALGCMIFSRAAGVAAALALATSFMGFGLSRVAMLDVPLTLWITAVMVLFLSAARNPRPLTVYGMYACAALAVLTKGLIGAVLPGMIILAWLIFTRRWRVLKIMRIPTGTLLFLAIAAPWHIAAGERYPEFWKFYFIHEHFARFTTEVHHRDKPWWFFPLVTVTGLMPWTPLFPAALKRARMASRDDALFLYIWAALPILFFSLSHSKLLPYIYPSFPPMAAILGAWLADAWRGLHPGASRKCAGGIGAVMLLAALAWPMAKPLLEADWQTLPLTQLFLFLGLLLILPAIISRSARPSLIALGAFTLAFGYIAPDLITPLRRESAKPLAMALKSMLKPGDEIVLYDSYRQDLPVYLNRNIDVVDYEGELAFGVSIEPKTHQWMIGHDEFWRRCAEANHRLLVLMSNDTYAAEMPHPGCRLHIIRPADSADGKSLMILTNEPQHE